MLKKVGGYALDDVFASLRHKHTLPGTGFPLFMKAGHCIL